MRKLSHPKISPQDFVVAQDEALNGCLNIMVLAELLEGSPPGLNPEIIAHAGFMIYVEAEKLQARLKLLTARKN